VTDSLTTDLSRALPGGVVVSRTSASAYRGRAAGTRQIGEELQVRYLLEGSLALDGSRIRVNAQLIDAAGDLHVWAERFDQPRGADLLLAQDVIVARLTRLVALHAVLARRSGSAPARWPIRWRFPCGPRERRSPAACPPRAWPPRANSTSGR
jgi:hypothetical protein